MERAPGHSGNLAARVQAGCSAVPLFVAACLFCAGIVTARFVWLRPSWLLLAAVVLSGLAGFAALRAARMAALPLALVWVVLGAWAAEMQPQPAADAQLQTMSDGLLRSVEGTVTSAGAIREESPDEEDGAAQPTQRVDLRLSNVEKVTDEEDRLIPARGGVRLTIRWPQGTGPRRIVCGARVRVLARLRLPEVYRTPGAWNRADYLLEQGITATSPVKAEDVETVQAPEGISLACRFAEAQQAAASRLLALPAAMRGFPAVLRMDDDDAVMLTTMVTGDRTFLTRTLRAGFERTGSFHMLVVSGLHLAIVAGCVLALARRLRIPRVPATLITLAAAFAYALFTGFGVPVQRSLWMVSVYLLGRLVYRERNALNTIGFAALCLLVASPRSLFEASFEMTVLAVVAIGGIAAPLLGAWVTPYLAALRNLRRVAMDAKLAPPLAQFRVTVRMIAERLKVLVGARMAWNVFPAGLRLGLRVLELVAVTVVIELAMALPMAVYFHRLTLFALPVNLFILPLLLVLMPAALVTMVCLVMWPPAALAPGAITAVFLHMGAGLVHVFGALRGSDVRLATPTLLQGAVFVLLLAGTMLLVRAEGRWWRWAGVVTLGCAAAVAVWPGPVEHPARALLFEAIDVGQGDSLLLITPEGKTLLVDGGGILLGPRRGAQSFDMGEEVVSAALWARGIRHLDVVAVSHAHEDHIGGLPAVVRNFHPGELWVGKNPVSPTYRVLLEEAARQHTRIRTLGAGDALWFGSAQVNVLAPMADYQPGATPSNDDSLVLHVRYGASSVLLEGDAERPIEERMLGEQGLASQLLKVGHHGSMTSTTPEFLARVAPQWAVISCGLHNRFGHPRAEVLEELQGAHVRTYSTAAQGTRCFQLDGRGVQPEAACDGDVLP